MRLTPVPVVALLRELWAKPRDMARFHEYVRRIQSGPEGEIFAPLIAANPMAKPHMVDLADKLLEMRCDEVLELVCAEAQVRLARSPLATKVSLTPVDDVGGAWSDRDMMDFDMRFGSKRPKRDYGYVTAVVYASEEVTPTLLRERILAAIYRAAHTARHGYPERVAGMLRQEGMALRFAQGKAPPHVDVEQARRALAPHLDSTLHATRVAAMFGDEAAGRMGHAALGVPPHGGIALALHDALRSPERPEDLV